MNQRVIPVISDFKTFDEFLNMEMEWCILMDFHISALEGLYKELSNHNKKGILHMDLVHGLTSDEAGTQFVCQKLHVHGVISTKAKVIETAKKNHTLSIMRLFLIDGRSIQRGCELGNRLQPDYLELLPANTKNGIAMVQKYCSLPLIAGGLIHSKQDVLECLERGVCSVTTSTQELFEIGGNI